MQFDIDPSSEVSIINDISEPKLIIISNHYFIPSF
jgi:hypothetical protein